MKNLFKEIALLIGFTVVFTGICICACDAPTLDKQIVNFGIGSAVIAVGGLTMWLSGRGLELDE